jgi:hypothetical protein
MSKWYIKLFKRLFNVAIHKPMIMYWFTLNNKVTDPLKFRLFLIQGLIKKHWSAVPHPVYGHPSTKLPPKRLTVCHLLEKIPATGKKARPQRRVTCCVLKTWKMKRNNLWVQ